MQACGFCGKWFKNKQSVRSHLEFCKDYNKLKEQGLAGPRPTEKPFEGTNERACYYRCDFCGYEQRTDFEVCPECGARVG